jgi:hypothetical protein
VHSKFKRLRCLAQKKPSRYAGRKSLKICGDSGFWKRAI